VFHRIVVPELQPVSQLSLEEGLDGPLYQALGEDPQFELKADPGWHRLAPGWYRFTAQFTVAEGEVVKPCLYPDYGEGLSEHTRIELPEPGPDGRIDGVIVVARPLRYLRFDPTVHRARFRIEGMSFQRLGRLKTLWYLLAGIQETTRCLFWEESLAGAFDFLRCAARGRLGEGASRLHARYQRLKRQSLRGYAQWAALFDGSSPARAEYSRQRCDKLPETPRISIVLPVYNPPLRFLRECLDSVVRQTYPHWELCIADDGSDRSVRKLLQKYAAQDDRIRLHLRAHRGHICEASNDALDLATGDWVGFLDHDDLLAADALSEVVAAIAEHPQARLFYTDEDKIDEAGFRCEPHFKPAWNPDLLLAQNYLCHFSVVDAALVREAGGLRPGFEGAQDHDLLLRCTEQLDGDAIVHIPRVLYHWRMLEGSTARGVAQKPYATEAGRRAVAEHLARNGIAADVEVLDSGHFRVRRRLAGLPSVSVVIPTRDRADLLRMCMQGLLDRTTYHDLEVVIVDNGSVEADAVELLATLARNPRVTVVPHAAPFNFSELVNRGVQATRGEVLCILNNDIEVIDGDWLREMVAHALRPEIGVVGCMLYYPDDTMQHAGVVLGVGGIAGHAYPGQPRGDHGYVGRATVAHNVSAVTGACMVLKRDVFTVLGGMDESLPVAFNDIDFCLRALHSGYRNLWTPFAELYHHESASRGLEDTPAKQARFQTEVRAMQRRWGEALLTDPAYSPNLSLDNGHFELAFPPRLTQVISRTATPAWALPKNDHVAADQTPGAKPAQTGPLALRELA